MMEIIQKRKNTPEVEIIVLTWNELDFTKTFLNSLSNGSAIGV